MTKIALVQQQAGKNRNHNLKRGLEAFKRAAVEGAELVIYPELAFSYFIPQREAEENFRELAEGIPGPATRAFCQAAGELQTAAAINMFERDGDRTYDTTVIIDRDGSIAGKNRMVHIYQAPCFYEKDYYQPGDLGAGVFHTGLGRVGVAICYDRHFPEYMRMLGLAGAELVVIPQAGAVDEWPEGLFQAEIRTAAFQNGYFAALANRVGEEDNITFAGESFVCGPEGDMIAAAPKLEEDILYAEIDFGRIPGCPARRHFMPDRHPRIYGPITEEKQ